MTNTIAIVTGASRLQGIGAAICQELANRQIDIFFTHWTPYDDEMPWDSSTNEVELLKQQLIDQGVRCADMSVDLSDEDAYIKVLDQVERELGKPTILINNAAYSTETSYRDLSVSSIDSHYAVNMRATMMLSAEFVKRFDGEVGGRIINMTSGQSRGPMPNELAYIATKGAIEAFTMSLAADAGKKRITVNAVDPGPTNSGWMTEEIKESLSARFPMGRVGEPIDCARFIGFLVSDEGEWMNGQVFHSNGGFW